jgi:hypothetical protein
MLTTSDVKELDLDRTVVDLLLYVIVQYTVLYKYVEVEGIKRCVMCDV